MSEAQKLLDHYRYALRLIYGHEIADKTELYTALGWYYVNLAHRCPDGSVGPIGIASSYRAKQIQAMADTLLNRLRHKGAVDSE